MPVDPDGTALNGSLPAHSPEPLWRKACRPAPGRSTTPPATSSPVARAALCWKLVHLSHGLALARAAKCGIFALPLRTRRSNQCPGSFANVVALRRGCFCAGIIAANETYKFVTPSGLLAWLVTDKRPHYRFIVFGANDHDRPSLMTGRLRRKRLRPRARLRRC